MKKIRLKPKKGTKKTQQKATGSSPHPLRGLIPGKEGIEAFLTPQERYKLNQMVLLSRSVVEGNLAGAHRSPLRGLSSEFSDHKPYGYGDDPKHIDWRVVARTDKYYVKRYEDETNLRLYLVLDRSASMNYGSGNVTKYVYAARLAAALGYVVVKARDSVGLCLHDDRVAARMEAGNSTRHLNDLLKQIQRHPPTGGSAVARALHETAAGVRRRALVAVLSDLLDDEDEMRKALGRLRKQHHDVIVFHVLDPMELSLEFKQPRRFEDMETDEKLQVHPMEIRETYQRMMNEFIERQQNVCAALGIDYRVARTDEPVDFFARAYLQERRRLTA